MTTEEKSAPPAFDQDTTTRDAWTVAFAIGIFGIPFGVLTVATGADVFMALAMSSFVFGGGSQFAAIGVIAAGGSPVSAVISGLLLNGRYVAFGMAIAPVLKGSFVSRMAASHFIIDESSAFAISRRKNPPAARHAFWVMALSAFLLWNLGTLIGAVAGNALGDPKILGLDAAFPAGFLALLFPLLDTPASKIAAIGGALTAVVLTPFVPAGIPIMAASIGAIGALLITGYEG